MPKYLLYFNQQWVGDHPEEWYEPRGPLARAVTEEMKAAGVYVFAGGLEEEDGPIYNADPTSGSVLITDGPYRRDQGVAGRVRPGRRARRRDSQDVGGQGRRGLRLAP